MKKAIIIACAAVFAVSAIVLFSEAKPADSKSDSIADSDKPVDTVFQRISNSISGREKAAADKKLAQKSIFQQSKESVSEYIDKTGDELLVK